MLYLELRYVILICLISGIYHLHPPQKQTNKQAKPPQTKKTRKTSDLLKFQAYQDHTIILRDLAFSFNKKTIKKKFPFGTGNISRHRQMCDDGINEHNK